MEHIRKILKTLDYFLVKFELISSIKVKEASKKIEEIKKKKSRKITNFQKKNGERLREKF